MQIITGVFERFLKNIKLLSKFKFKFTALIFVKYEILILISMMIHKIIPPFNYFYYDPHRIYIDDTDVKLTRKIESVITRSYQCLKKSGFLLSIVINK